MSRMKVVLIALAALVLLVPVYSAASGNGYALILFGRVLVFAIAAVGLNIALGYGGMVSLGHAMYIGIGAYGVALLSAHGVHSGWLHLLAVVAVTAVVAAAVGWVSLRTQGIAFIMITLAFAQLAYFVFVSLRMYGGDDGLTLARMSDFGVFANNRTALYLAMAATLAGALLVSSQLVGSRFGLVLRAARINERRVDALGTASSPYKLLAYVLSAQICALAGFFLVNLTGFASPAYMAWTVSGELILMVLLGGVGTIVGPVIGAFALLLLEEGLKACTEHWPLPLGGFIVAMVVFLRGGLWGVLGQRESTQGEKALLPLPLAGEGRGEGP
jgi:branched-chain amino acid transport system permease protein